MIGLIEVFDRMSFLFVENSSDCSALNYLFTNPLQLSANYFGDLIKKETGQSAKDYALNKTLNIAKDKIFEENKTVNEIAYELGFKYPQHFTRLFKQKVGVSPI